MKKFLLGAIVVCLLVLVGEHVVGQTVSDDVYVVPVSKAIVPVFGSLSLSPQIYYFNSSYSVSSLQFSYGMADGTALKSGMSFSSTSGLFTYYTSSSSVGQYTILRNVSYWNTQNVFTTISHSIIVQVVSDSSVNQLNVLFKDDFTSGNLSKWNLIDGTMNLVSQQLVLYQNNTLLTSVNSFDLTSGITLAFTALTSWTSVRGFVVYVDKQNYYEINLSTSPLKITRYLNGQPTILLSSTKLLQIHASGYYSSYKVYLQYSSSKGFSISLGKIGTLSNDYVLSYLDSDATTVFKNVKIGFFDKSTGNPTQSTCRIQQVSVYDGKLTHTRQAQTYYVNPSTGSDSNDGTSQANALKSISAGLYRLLPDDTLMVGNGLYRGSVLINRDASNEHPITIKALNQPTVSTTFTTSPYTHTAILDGSMVLDNSKFTKVVNSPAIYKTNLKFTPDYVYQDGSRMSLAMKPLPYDLQDEYLSTNYLPVKNTSTVSGSITYLILDDMFKYDASGNKVSDGFWVGAQLFHYYLGANVVFTRTVVSYNASTNTLGVLYKDSVWGDLVLSSTGDAYAIANHIGCFSQSGQFVSVDNQVLVSLASDPASSGVVLEATAYANGIKFANSMEGIIVQGFLAQRFSSDGIVCSSGCANVQVLNCSSQYNSGSGTSFTGSSNILVDGGEMKRNLNNGVNYGGGVKDSIVQNTYVHNNVNNGIWVGNGGDQLFYCWNILLKSNKVGPQFSQRLHPDNIQLASVHNITLESNVLQQDGDQNMWMEQNGLVIFKRNIFLGGPVGVNHAANIVMVNNVFYNAWLRFSFKFEKFVTYSSLVGLSSIADWSGMFDSIVSQTTSGSTLVWSRNSALVSRIQGYSTYSSLTNTDKTDIVAFINTVINDTSFMQQNKDYVLPLLGTQNVAYPYWIAIAKRGILDKSSGKFTYSNPDISIIEEVRGLTRAILDELVLDGFVSKSLGTFYPRTVSIKNNAIIESSLQLPNSSYSLLPYWSYDYNYIENTNNYQYNIWKALVGNYTIFEKSLSNTTHYFVNMTTNDFRSICASNITLIDKGVDVGLSYYGKAPDIGAFEMNCGGVVPVPSISISKPAASSTKPVSPSSSRNRQSSVVSEGMKTITGYSMGVLFIFCLFVGINL